MKNVTFDTVISLYKRSIIGKAELIRVLKTLKLSDEQAIILYDLEVWGQVEMKAHFFL